MKFLVVWYCHGGVVGGAALLLLTAEISALVVDFGSYNTKAGYAGDDTPKCVLPSVRTFGVSHLCFRWLVGWLVGSFLLDLFHCTARPLNLKSTTQHVGYAPVMPGVKDAMTLQVHSQAASSSLSWKTDAMDKRPDGEDKEKASRFARRKKMRTSLTAVFDCRCQQLMRSRQCGSISE